MKIIRGDSIAMLEKGLLPDSHYILTDPPEPQDDYIETVARMCEQTGAKGFRFPRTNDVECLVYELSVMRKVTGLVLDPLAGSGSIGKACDQLGLPYIGIEIGI